MTVSITDGTPDDHPDLPARIAAATALRRLAHAIVGHRVDIADLREIGDVADRFAARAESGEARSRADEMATSPRFLAAMSSGSMSDMIEDGAFVDLFHDSPVSGSASPFSVGLRLRPEGDQSVGSVMLAEGWEGAPGRGHGGVVAACVDETIGGLLPILGTMAFTGQLSLTYRAPCPLGVPLEFRAWLVGREGRRLHIDASGSGPDGVFVESTSLFIAVDFTQLAEPIDGTDESG